jgi:hypothetical protein
MSNFLKKDAFLLGFGLGIVVPAIIYALLYALFQAMGIAVILNKKGTIMLIAVFLNMFLLRYYLVKEKFDRTGRGVLLATFMLTIAYFWIYFNE